ncbi:MAG: hypothetical protein HYU86_10965 [Chloroflexi bacterium]|nr:hypothetical protein [Chloroflexota bacterium]
MLLVLLPLTVASPSLSAAQDTLIVSGFVWYDDNLNGIPDGGEELAAATVKVFSGTYGSQGRQPHVVTTTSSGTDGRYTVAFSRPSETPIFLEARAIRPGFPTRSELDYNYIVTTRALDFSRTATLSVNLGLRPGFPFYPRPLDYPIPNGHFFTQMVYPQRGPGYSITDDAVAPFWSEFQHLGEVPLLGYPASRRFLWGGFVSQVMQRQVFQWRPEAGQVYFVNVFDELSRAGKDPWLLAFRQVPPPFDTSTDKGLPWEEVVGRHLALLDADPAIKARYFADPDPIAHFGLPMSYGDFGNVFVIRGQRAVLQHWKVETPWAHAGDVTIANGGDIAIEAGLIPPPATLPEPPPG